MSFDSARHVIALLEMAFEREVDERAPQGSQFHGGRPAALDDCQVRRGQVLIQVVNVAQPFYTLCQIQGCGIEPRTGYRNHAQRRQPMLQDRIGATAQFQQRFADVGSSNRADHQRLRPVAQAPPHCRLIPVLLGIEWQNVPEISQRCRSPLPAVREEEPERLIGHVLLFSDKQGRSQNRGMRLTTRTDHQFSI